MKNCIQTLNAVEKLHNGKEIIKAIRFIAGESAASHSREVMDDIPRIVEAHLPRAGMLPDNEFED
jgi:hypothetical protein